MSVKVLIDNIVQQTTILIAQLATAAGIRAPLAHVANEVFLTLVRELESQGVGRKVIADMFGLALRSYQLKVQRLSESATERDASLWEVVFQTLRKEGLMTRGQVLLRFPRDDESTVRGILNDLVESGFVFRTGRGHKTSFRAASEEELEHLDAADSATGIDELVWIGLYRLGPAEVPQIAEHLKLSAEVIKPALERLVAAEKVEQTRTGESCRYHATHCIIPIETDAGWEAALWDHFQAMVTAMGIKLRAGQDSSLPQDVLGGSTYSFDVWPDHPCEDEAMGLLRDTRKRISECRARVTEYNDNNEKPAEGWSRVTFYVGQGVREEMSVTGSNEDSRDD